YNDDILENAPIHMLHFLVGRDQWKTHEASSENIISPLNPDPARSPSKSIPKK
ncbi:hypothetical protein HAX54_012972, partial [Datura stramonium]|nr:hypothetical protein [Datura stramonium]